MALVGVRPDDAPPRVDVVGPASLDPASRALVAGVWAFRAKSEREASLRFARLARQLEGADAEGVVVDMARDAAEDEVRHVAICAEIAAAYGHRAPPELVADAREIGPRAAPPRERVLYEVTAFCCVTESVNAALMTVSFERAEAPAVRAAVREILRDEVAHARLGWAHLAAERARGHGDALASALPAMLAGTVREELFAPTDGEHPDPRLAGHGELPRALRIEIFERTLLDVVFPGLEAHGVATDAGRAWLARMRAGQTP